MEKAIYAFLKQEVETGQLDLARLENIFQENGYREEAGGRERILVLRLDEIGDNILSSAFLRELRRNFPVAWITLVVRDSAYNIMELCPHVNEVLHFPSWKNSVPLAIRIPVFVKFCNEHLWKHHYTKCFCPRWDVDIQFSLMLGFLSGAQRRIGYSETVTNQKAVKDRGWDAALTDVIVTPPYVVHEVEKNLYLLRLLGYAAENDSLELWLGNRDIARAKELLAGKPADRRLIAVTIGSREKYKSYPPELMAEAFNMLAAKGFCFTLLGGPEDRGTGEDIISNLPDGTALNLAGKTSLRESCAVISQASLLIGNDTGLTHAAAALSKPIVELISHPLNAPVFTLSSYARFFPWKARCVVLRPYKAMDGCEHLSDDVSQVRGCCSDEAHCIRGIAPERIASAVEKLL